MEFSSLIGIIANIPKKIDSEILDEADFFFVKNPYFKGDNNLVSILDNYSKVQTGTWITPQQIYVKVKRAIPFLVPCMECPAKEEIENMGIPTI